MHPVYPISGRSAPGHRARARATPHSSGPTGRSCDGRRGRTWSRATAEQTSETRPGRLRRGRDRPRKPTRRIRPGGRARPRARASSLAPDATYFNRPPLSLASDRSGEPGWKSSRMPLPSLSRTPSLVPSSSSKSGQLRPTSGCPSPRSYRRETPQRRSAKVGRAVAGLEQVADDGLERLGLHQGHLGPRQVEDPSPDRMTLRRCSCPAGRRGHRPG